MPSIPDLYLGMAIAAFVVFMAGLAWGQIYTAGGKRAVVAKPAKDPAPAAKTPDRLAA